jgi:hypothetical protein
VSDGGFGLLADAGGGSFAGVDLRTDDPWFLVDGRDDASRLQYEATPIDRGFDNTFDSDLGMTGSVAALTAGATLTTDGGVTDPSTADTGEPETTVSSPSTDLVGRLDVAGRFGKRRALEDDTRDDADRERLDQSDVLEAAPEGEQWVVDPARSSASLTVGTSDANLLPYGAADDQVIDRRGRDSRGDR